ncbi:hypothetical protein MMC25_000482 [Agyrium rufum]|nr:hypothetical protein [Agyrium rufum]
MAATIDSAYFPSLEQILNGGLALFSWKAVAELLQTDNSSYATAHQLGKLLNTRDIFKELQNAIRQPPAPTSDSTAAFETKTSAINVTPNSRVKQDLRQIKNDTLWLSKEFKLDELYSLRLVVLEWQSRPTARLSSGSFGDNGVDAEDADGGLSFAREIDASLAADRAWFDAPGGRRLRLVDTYLWERRSILQILLSLLCAAYSKDEVVVSSNTAKSKAAEAMSWAGDLGQKIVDAWIVPQESNDRRGHWFVDAINSFSHTLDEISQTDTHFSEIQAESFAYMWNGGLLQEGVYIMQIIQTTQTFVNQMSGAEPVLTWFRLMHRYGFFDDLVLPFESINVTYVPIVQAQAALLSLAFIQASSSFDALAEISHHPSSRFEQNSDPDYLLSIGAVSELNDILLDAALKDSKNASLAVLAWSMILQMVREAANESRVTRETCLSERAVDSFSRADRSGRDQTSLNRSSSMGSDTSQPPAYVEDLIDLINNAPVEDDCIAIQALKAIGGMGVFEVVANLASENATQWAGNLQPMILVQRRHLLLDLLGLASERMEYEVDFFSAVLASLGSEDCLWLDLYLRLRHTTTRPLATFFAYPSLLEKTLRAAQSRFPHEAIPFLHLSRTLAALKKPLHAPHFREMLDEMPSFTTELGLYTRNEEAYDENGFPHRRLLDNLRMFPEPKKIPGSVRLRYMSEEVTDANSAFIIPAESIGIMLTTTPPYVVMWNHSYSALRYLGKNLSIIVEENELQNPDTIIKCTQLASQSIGLLSSLLLSNCRLEDRVILSCSDRDAVLSILEEASDGLDRNDDIVALILNVFEQTVYCPRTIATSEISTELMGICLYFIKLLVVILPERVWPFFNRSGLLGLNGRNNQLSDLIALPDPTPGDLLNVLGVLHVFDALVEDAVSHAVSRRVRMKDSERFDGQSRSSFGVSDASISRILLAFLRALFEILASIRAWKHAPAAQLVEISEMVVRILLKILDYRYTTDGNLETPQETFTALHEAATFILDTLLESSSDASALRPFYMFLEEGLLRERLQPDLGLIILLDKRTQITIDLLTALLKLKSLLGLVSSCVEDAMTDFLPILSRLFVSQASFKVSILKLLTLLVRAINSQTAATRSLLGSLGHDAAIGFVNSMASSISTLEDVMLVTMTWRFFTAVVSCQQRWMSIYLFTGEDPKSALRNGQPTELTRNNGHASILNKAMTKLRTLAELPLEQAITILDFLRSSADRWPLVVARIESDNELIDSLLEFPSTINTMNATGSSRPAGMDSREIKVAALIAGILAMFVHSASERGDTSAAKKVRGKWDYYCRFGVSRIAYNESLHTNLQNNFNKKYAPFTLANFKQTSYAQPQLGDHYYYSLQTLSRCMGFDSAWYGRQGHGYVEEFIRANLNLSVIEAQKDLLNDWASLVVELSLALHNEKELQESLVTVIQDCLTVNLEYTPSEAIFVRLAQARADLAFTLMKQILLTIPDNLAVQSILPLAWRLTSQHLSRIGTTLASGDAEYERTLQRILYLSLQPYATEQRGSLSQSQNSATKAIASSTTTILEVVAIVVAEGFRSLTTVLHDSPASVMPSDFLILIAILRTALAVPGVDFHPIHLVTLFTDNSTVRYACTLLSWADQLQIDDQPIYAEISTQFLLELSALPALAESLAVDGILSQIAAASIMNYFKRPGRKGPQVEPSVMLEIWSWNILPMILNMLRAVGAPIAGEVVGFLNEYANHMNQNSNARRPNATMTFSQASEFQSLGLISIIIDAYRDAGPSAGILSIDVGRLQWDKVAAKEDIRSWLEGRNHLRECIQSTNEQEVAWATQKPLSMRLGAINRLEEKIVEELQAALLLLPAADS